MKVGIIGGGIAGLAAGYRLTQQGHQVTLVEASPFLGGLVRTFEVGGERLESFYHHLFTTDTTVIRLINDLGLDDRMTWRESRVGFFYGDRIYPFVTPVDLLRFRPLPFLDRIRAGLMAVKLRKQKEWADFERITAKEWIIRNAGQRVFDVIWGPLLAGKFGDAADELAMAWLWNKIHLRFASRKGGPMQREQLGYMLGSFGVLVEELARRLQEAGAEVRTGAAVETITVEDGRANGFVLVGGERVYTDAVVAAMQSQSFQKIAPPLGPEYERKLTDIRWQWALCMVLSLKKSLSPIYWLNIADRDLPFLAIVEHTNFIEPERYDGERVVYISNYLRPDHPYFQMDEQALFDLYLPGLQQINPQFSPDWINQRWLFKGPYAQPIVTTGYGEKIPEHRTPVSGLYLATMSQIYPQDRGQNYSILMGERVADMVVADRQAVPSA